MSSFDYPTLSCSDIILILAKSQIAVVSGIQQEISKLQEELVRLDAKMNTKFQEFNDEFRGDLQTLLGQYFGQPTTGVTGKRKGVMGGSPPGFAPKEFVEPNASQVLVGASVIPLVDVGSAHLKNHLPVVDGSDRPSRLKCSKFDTSSMTHALISKPASRSILPTVMADRKQKGLCFWCGAKYHIGHKCVKLQLYQFLPEPMSDSEVEEFHVYSDKLEELNVEIVGYSEAREREFPLVQEVESKVKELYEMIVGLNSNHISLRTSF
ncbi:hypothetical protein Goari_014587 [Gossypium aridum]|uniref:Uncharacterized protein n=1 Tax=Gossypium aridum TaxID=34290 RepID=A0A7J8XJF2_GOSAI|nr:hypothetical protein [Gossypium aridum]